MPRHDNPGVADMTLFESQVLASPLAFHGDTLVQSIDGELRAWNAVTMQRTDTWALPHRHFCFVQDGTLVALGVPQKVAGTEIHRIAKGKASTHPGPILPAGTYVVLPARTPDEIYVSSGEHIYLVRGSEVAATLAHPDPNAGNRDLWISRRDGRLVGNDRDGGIRQLDLKTSNAYPTPKRYIVHLAEAMGDRLWYSFSSKAEWNAQTLILAPVDKPMADERTIDVAPARIVHLASHADAVAALLITLDKKATWSIAVFDESGKQRWRADVPEDFSEPALNHGFVAIGDKRVVLASPDGKLLWWDARTGDRT